MGKSVRIGPDMPDLPMVQAREEQPAPLANEPKAPVESEREIGKFTVRTNNSVMSAKNETAKQREARVKDTRSLRSFTVKTF